MSNGTLFIDSNMYLYLYNLVNSKEVEKILNPLEQLRDSIFVTEQIADEVYKNKVSVAADFLSKQFTELHQFSELKLKNFNIPEHLLNVNKSEVKELRKGLDDVRKQTDQIKKKLIKLANETLSKVSKSEDEISRKLDKLFKNAVEPSDGELKKARLRKEYGNPPGKKGDPLGDQVNWEQLLGYLINNSIKKLWVITNDADFCKYYEGNLFLNAHLQRDLESTSVKEIYCFNDLIAGLADFRKKNDKKIDKLPEGKEADEINKDLYSNLVVYNPATGLVEPLLWSPMYGYGSPTYTPALTGMAMATANSSGMAFGTNPSSVFSFGAQNVAPLAVSSSPPGTLFVSRHPMGNVFIHPVESTNDDGKK